MKQNEVSGRIFAEMLESEKQKVCRKFRKNVELANKDKSGTAVKVVYREVEHERQLASELKDFALTNFVWLATDKATPEEIKSLLLGRVNAHACKIYETLGINALITFRLTVRLVLHNMCNRCVIPTKEDFEEARQTLSADIKALQSYYKERILRADESRRAARLEQIAAETGESVENVEKLLREEIAAYTRRLEMESKAAEIKEAAEKYGIPFEIAQKMYMDGLNVA